MQTSCIPLCSSHGHLLCLFMSFPHYLFVATVFIYYFFQLATLPTTTIESHLHVFFFSIYLSFILCHCNSLRILSTPFMISGLLSVSRAKYLGHLKILSKVHFITEIPLGLNFCHKSLLSCKFLTSSWGTLECGKWKEPNVTVQFALCLQLGRN